MQLTHKNRSQWKYWKRWMRKPAYLHQRWWSRFPPIAHDVLVHRNMKQIWLPASFLCQNLTPPSLIPRCAIRIWKYRGGFDHRCNQLIFSGDAKWLQRVLVFMCGGQNDCNLFFENIGWGNCPVCSLVPGLVLMLGLTISSTKRLTLLHVNCYVRTMLSNTAPSYKVLRLKVLDSIFITSFTFFR